MTMTEVRRFVLSRLRGDHKTRLLTLSALLWGYLKSGVLGVAAIARGVESDTSTRHSIKRVWRFLRNINTDPQVVMAALVKEAEALGCPMIVALDWVELRGGMRALVASLCIAKGRALPVAWTVVHANKFFRSQNNIENGFMRLFGAFLTDPGRAVIVADRGFRRASFLSLLDYLGFGYVVRVAEKVTVRGEVHEGLLSEYGIREREEVDFGRVWYREDEIIATRIVSRWARGSAEPWHLATNTKKSLNKICSIYALRMEEEESFRDLKSHRYGAALRYVKLSGPERYERIFMLWALGAWFFHGQGQAAMARNMHLGLSSAPNTRCELSIVRIGRELLQKPLGAPAALLRCIAA
jgi:hypothetical protein